MTKAKNVQEYIVQQQERIAANPTCGTSHYNLAVALIGLKKYDEAEKELFNSLECSPTLVEAYAQLGGICMQNGDYDGCMHYNQQAVKIRKNFAEGYGNIGFIYLQKGNVEEAIKFLEKAVSINPNFIQAYATLANAYLMQGLIDKSIQTNLQVLEIESNFAVAHNNLSIAYLEKKEYDLARKHCNKAISLGYKVPDEIIAELNSVD